MESGKRRRRGSHSDKSVVCEVLFFPFSFMHSDTSEASTKKQSWLQMSLGMIPNWFEAERTV